MRRQWPFPGKVAADGRVGGGDQAYRRVEWRRRSSISTRRSSPRAASWRSAPLLPGGAAVEGRDRQERLRAGDLHARRRRRSQDGEAARRDAPDDPRLEPAARGRDRARDPRRGRHPDHLQGGPRPHRRASGRGPRRRHRQLGARGGGAPVGRVPGRRRRARHPGRRRRRRELHRRARLLQLRAAQGGGDPRPRRDQRHRPRGVVGVLGLHHRRADAARRRPPGGGTRLPDKGAGTGRKLAPKTGDPSTSPSRSGSGAGCRAGSRPSRPAGRSRPPAPASRSGGGGGTGSTPRRDRGPR